MLLVTCSNDTDHACSIVFENFMQLYLLVWLLFGCLICLLKDANVINITLSHLRSKESIGIHKPCIPALLPAGTTS